MFLPRNMARRRFPRYLVDRPLVAHVYSGETTTIPLRGRWRELSEGGIGASIAEQISPGAVVTLQLGPSLSVYGTVRYLRGFYHGFEFVLLRDKQREAIKGLCKALEPRRAVHSQK